MTAIPYSARHSRQTLRSEIPRRRMPSPMVRPDTMGKEKTTSVFQPRAFNQRLTNQQKHKARTSIDTAAELRIQARRPREPMMPPLKSGNPDNRPRTTKPPRFVYDNNRQRRSAHKASLSYKRQSKEATNHIKLKPSIHHEPTAEQSFLLKNPNVLTKSLFI